MDAAFLYAVIVLDVVQVVILASAVVSMQRFHRRIVGILIAKGWSLQNEESTVPAMRRGDRADVSGQHRLLQSEVRESSSS